ncbi:carbonic anhydrase 14 [Xenopus laevis]|uniref:Carbonic anhydrase n=1 Tax=Xenopus laevis TaxID=8355 RepID=A0A8J1LK62_XENLA|nr:carbonic anhydrase 14 [Xenopus laevis]
MSVPTTCLLARMLCLPFLILSISHVTVRGSGWTYTGHHGQENWPESYPDCGGTAQSPINIRTSNVSYDETLPPIEPEGYNTPGDQPFTLTNNGHSAQLSLPSTMELRGLPSTFRAVQLHLHWGSANKQAGSEHRLDGEEFPAELHIVHYNADKYADINEAKNKPDGLAVLGVFFEIGATDNPAYANILRHLDNIRYAGQSISVPSFNVRHLLPENLEDYFRYQGSLTTPPCYQSVLWTVFYHPVEISRSQLEKLQTTLYSTEEGVAPEVLGNNVRETQPLKPATTTECFHPSSFDATGTVGNILAIIFGIFLGIVVIGFIIYFIYRKTRKDTAGTSKSQTAPTEVKTV